AVGRCQLCRADSIFAARQNNVRVLSELLEPFADHLVLPVLDENVSYLAYPIVVRENAPFTRGALCHELEKYGVETRPLFSCLPTQQLAFQHLRGKYEGQLPNAERLGRDAFYIGCHQFLTNEDMDHVAKAFRRSFDGIARESAKTKNCRS
ncbi:MAG: DegT/DnrJ/EryC1/StrS family aminotransferase, partial [Phycisphaerae bacterium]|nr:DegT/DnrJ/EryC1/StrS family aminotransferase [Phycisphaerae bacterium]